jgi:hypothetical protein
VRVIFELPPSLRVNDALPTRLVFVEWFTPLSAPDSIHGLRSTKASWQSIERAERRVEVLPVERIVNAAHLQPYFGARADRQLRSSTVLDQHTAVKSFMLNTWITPRIWSIFGR